MWRQEQRRWPEQRRCWLVEAQQGRLIHDQPGSRCLAVRTVRNLSSLPTSSQRSGANLSGCSQLWVVLWIAKRGRATGVPAGMVYGPMLAGRGPTALCA